MPLNIYDVADLLNARIEIERPANSSGRFVARISGFQARENDNMVSDASGFGNCPVSALNNCAAYLQGKRIESKASEGQIKYSVPELSKI